MKKRLISLIILIQFLLINNIFAENSNNVDPRITKAYNLFIKKIESSYSLEKQIILLKQIDNVLDKALNNKKLPKKNKLLINDFVLLNNKKLKKNQIKFAIINKSKNETIIKNIQISNENKFNNILNKNSNKNNLNKVDIIKKFKNVSYDKNNIFLENGIWYFYNFSDFKYFKLVNNLKTKDLEHNGIDLSSSLVFLNNDNNIGFVTNYKKIKLIDDKIIYGITNKYNILLEIKDDKEFLYNDTDKLFSSLKLETQKITSGLSDESKIKTIYNYILKNNKYSEKIDLNDKKIFSGINLYKNKEGVCEAYVKLFLYMLNFAGIKDTEIIRGYVIDSENFPNIGHAWVRIGNQYYDPTFDDPIGSTKTKTIKNYKFFGLPKDLFYTNRYNYNKLPEELKTKDSNYRKNLIQINLFKIYDKYESNNFNILKETKFKKDNNLKYNETFNLSLLEKIIPLYEVRKGSYTKNGKNYFIKKLNYYILKDDNIPLLLEQLNYDLKGYYFFERFSENGSKEYRLGYNLIY